MDTKELKIENIREEISKMYTIETEDYRNNIICCVEYITCFSKMKYTHNTYSDGKLEKCIEFTKEELIIQCIEREVRNMYTKCEILPECFEIFTESTHNREIISQSGYNIIHDNIHRSRDNITLATIQIELLISLITNLDDSEIDCIVVGDVSTKEKRHFLDSEIDYIHRSSNLLKFQRGDVLHKKSYVRNYMDFFKNEQELFDLEQEALNSKIYKQKVLETEEYINKFTKPHYKIV